MTTLDRHIRALAAELAGLRARVEETGPQLAFSTIEHGAIAQSEYVDSGDVDEWGNPVYVARDAALFGKQFDGTNVAATLNGPTPPQTTIPTVVPAIGGLTVSWDGMFVDGAGSLDITIAAPMDFSRVEIHASTDRTFDAVSADTLHDTIETPRGASRFIMLPDGDYAVALVVRSLSGGAGPQSFNGYGSPRKVTAEDVLGGNLGGARVFHDDEDRSGAVEGDLWYRSDGTGAYTIWQLDNNVWTQRISGSGQIAQTLTGKTITGSLIRATGTGDVSLVSTGHGLQVGPDTGSNLALDGNEIQSRNNKGTDSLNLNLEGGNVNVGKPNGTDLVSLLNATHISDPVNRDTLVVNSDFDAGFSSTAIRVFMNEEVGLAGFNVLGATIGVNNTTPNRIFTLRGDGVGQAEVSWNGGGADFAENFESADGTALPFGRAVTLTDDGKVRLAQAGEFVLGVTSATPTVVGNAPLNWPSMWLRDVYGAYQLDKDGKRQLNPDFDPAQADQYVTRDLRPEWNAIGLLGRIVADDDGTVAVTGRAVVGTDGAFTAGTKTGLRCVGRVDDSHILLLVVPQ